MRSVNFLLVDEWRVQKTGEGVNAVRADGPPAKRSQTDSLFLYGYCFFLRDLVQL